MFIDEDFVNNYNLLKYKYKINNFFIDTLNILYYIVFQIGERGFSYAEENCAHHLYQR